jgi:acyl carrier protein
MADEIETIVYEAIRRVNEEMDHPALKEPTLQSKLFEALDSMGVLDFILEVESALQDRYGRYIQIADEWSMDPQKTPFQTIESAVEFIRKRVDNG